MRRYPVVIGATAAGLAGVLTFHSHPGTSALGATRTGSSAGSTHAGTSAGSTAGTSNAPPTTKPTTTGPTTPTTAPATAPVVKSVTGSLEQYGYGQLSVKVTASGATITNVAVATLQTADQYSTQLADQIVPMLRREVLSAQSAHIQGISGATYTSEAYALSVQSAIDKLKA